MLGHRLQSTHTPRGCPLCPVSQAGRDTSRLARGKGGVRATNGRVCTVLITLVEWKGHGVDPYRAVGQAALQDHGAATGADV